MSHRVYLESVFVLHRRPYRNSSWIVELFTHNHGRVSAVARSARGPKSRFKGILEPFSPLVVSWSGKGELKSLNSVEADGLGYFLEGNLLFCGFYLNELLLKLLERDDPSPKLFHLYQSTLNNLKSNKNIQATLRLFEKRLLQDLGYGMPLKYEAESGLHLKEDECYRYIPEKGFIRCESNLSEKSIFTGRALMALEQENFVDEQISQQCKRLLRLYLGYHLGKKNLKSRELMK